MIFVERIAVYVTAFDCQLLAELLDDSGFPIVTGGALRSQFVERWVRHAAVVNRDDMVYYSRRLDALVMSETRFAKRADLQFECS
jgi:hypothetical protein